MIDKTVKTGKRFVPAQDERTREMTDFDEAVSVRKATEGR
jgi:hypothetical protein